MFVSSFSRAIFEVFSLMNDRPTRPTAYEGDRQPVAESPDTRHLYRQR